MNIIKILFILLFSSQIFEAYSRTSASNTDYIENNRTGSYTIDCIINGDCTNSGDHIEFYDLIASVDILSWKEGHGGYAVELNGKTYLMDFVENGIERRPFIKNSTVIEPEIQRNINLVFPNESSEFKKLLAKKLSEINGYSSDLAFSYLGGILSYNWIFVDFDLRPTPDIDTIANLPDAKYTPLANRRQQTILINNPTWKKLDYFNQVGLILHELNYSLVVPIFERILATNVDMRRASLKARELTSYLFRRSSQFKKIRGFNTISKNHIDYIFNSTVHDLTKIIWNNDGSMTLPIGKSVISLQTQILRLDGISRPQTIDWGASDFQKFDRQIDLESICKLSKSAYSAGKSVSVNVYHSVQGNLRLKFNISEVSSLELVSSNDLITEDTWMFSFGMRQNNDCRKEVRAHVKSLVFK